MIVWRSSDGSLVRNAAAIVTPEVSLVTTSSALMKSPSPSKRTVGLPLATSA